jgi:predicted Zn-dependent protease
MAGRGALNRMSRAEKILQMLEREPDDAFLNFGLAMELVKAGDHEAAIQRFERVLTVDPHYTAAHYHKAQVLIARGRLDEAPATLDAGLKAARAIGNAHAECEMQELLESIE